MLRARPATTEVRANHATRERMLDAAEADAISAARA